MQKERREQGRLLSLGVLLLGARESPACRSGRLTPGGGGEGGAPGAMEVKKRVDLRRRKELNSPTGARTEAILRGSFQKKKGRRQLEGNHRYVEGCRRSEGGSGPAMPPDPLRASKPAQAHPTFSTGRAQVGEWVSRSSPMGHYCPNSYAVL